MVTTTTQKPQTQPSLLPTYADAARDTRVGFDQLPLQQQLLARLFMWLLQSDDSSDNLDQQTEEQKDREHDLSTAMGYSDDAKGLSEYRGFRSEMKKSDWNWLEKANFSGIVKNGWKGVEKVTGCVLEIGDRQKQVMSVMADAARAAGVSPEFMHGAWGSESSFGKGLKSSTGCEGDWQFTQGSFSDQIRNHGSEIADGLRRHGEAALADTVQRFSAGLKDHTLAVHDGALEALRMQPKVSTYAASFLVADNARTIGVDATKKESFGALYAAYNIGAGGAKKLLALSDTPNVGEHIGSAAEYNPAFYRNGATGAQALQSYQAHIEANAHSFDRTVGTAGPMTNPETFAAAAHNAAVATNDKPGFMAQLKAGISQLIPVSA